MFQCIKKRRLTGPEKNGDIYLNFMHFNRRNGSVVLPSFKVMIFTLGFSTPHGIASDPKGCTELTLPWVQFITSIDLIGPLDIFQRL